MHNGSVQRNSLVLSIDPAMTEFADDPQLSVVPLIDGASLIDLVTEFETAQGWSPAGGYGGLIPRYFNYGDLTDYFAGSTWRDDTRIWVLGHQCGDVGCWPLETKVDIKDSTVTWSNFRQPHRDKRDYRGLGPFIFDKNAYRAAVQTAAIRVQPRT